MFDKASVVPFDDSWGTDDIFIVKMVMNIGGPKEYLLIPITPAMHQIIEKYRSKQGNCDISFDILCIVVNIAPRVAFVDRETMWKSVKWSAYAAFWGTMKIVGSMLKEAEAEGKGGGFYAPHIRAITKSIAQSFLDPEYAMTPQAYATAKWMGHNER